MNEYFLLDIIAIFFGTHLLIVLFNEWKYQMMTKKTIGALIFVAIILYGKINGDYKSSGFIHPDVIVFGSIAIVVGSITGFFYIRRLSIAANKKPQKDGK